VLLLCNGVFQCKAVCQRKLDSRFYFIFNIQQDVNRANYNKLPGARSPLFAEKIVKMTLMDVILTENFRLMCHSNSVFPCVTVLPGVTLCYSIFFYVIYDIKKRRL
jgi:hypothetical protein